MERVLPVIFTDVGIRGASSPTSQYVHLHIFHITVVFSYWHNITEVQWSDISMNMVGNTIIVHLHAYILCRTVTLTHVPYHPLEQ